MITGIPTTPQLAETYYIDDFEPDRDDEADETVKPLQTVNGDETNQDMEMFLGYLQSALNGPDQGKYQALYSYWTDMVVSKNSWKSFVINYSIKLRIS